MMTLSTIRAFQNVLTSFKFEQNLGMFPEEFAVKRFLKKMEVPDEERSKERREACFTSYTDFDSSLRLPCLLPGNWYKARILIHDWCKRFHLDPVVITNGSESKPTRGFNSIESKLMRSAWECTPDCFDLWADLAYETLAIKRSTRTRFAAVMCHNKSAIKAFHKRSFSMFSMHKNFAFLCFKRMLSYVTFVREASRFSTVRKNNEKDRPIDVQPLCNMLVQRRIGNGFRTLLKDLGVDLNTLADEHRLRIKDRRIATIDLKNASDSIHIDLVRFLFPARVFSLLEKARTFYTEGLDGNYYITKKISAMGNGFTFELMTVIIRALGLQYDYSFSVFGDDIIIPNEFAFSLIADLEAVGFQVNGEKSFIGSNFRESCGGNYHDDFGYIESYDFEYPESIHDCVVLNNKAFALGLKYPQFKKLSQLLLRAVPHALHGPAGLIDRDISETDGGRRGYAQDVNLSTTFWSTRLSKNEINDPRLARKLKHLCYDPTQFRIVKGYRYKPKLASPSRDNLTMRRHCGKYFMYLYACRRTDDIITDRGSWQEVAYLSDGKTLLRVKSLVD